ncbi:hypothetical protein pEaSNUABM52_00032 [Erwinia phage pEp_SNUABM_52]|nr:hypothetical protein pEaSNUABM52_00032 [Erwinia phage pEp_SNUABM_52]
MENENEMRFEPKHVVNGFQFNAGNVRLMAYALDLTRLGAKLGPDFWEKHIISDQEEQDIMMKLKVKGTVIHSRNFDIFESLERCRLNAAIVLDALYSGFNQYADALHRVISNNEMPVASLKTVGAEYFTRTVSTSDFELCTRSQAAMLVDYEPIVIEVDRDNFVLSGNWHAISFADAESRLQLYHKWLFNHTLTTFRMKQILNLHLRTAYPESFGG